MYTKPRVGIPVSLRNRNQKEVFGVLKTKLFQDHLTWLKDNRPHHRHELHDFTDCPLATYVLDHCSKRSSGTDEVFNDARPTNLRPPLRKVA